MRNLFLLVALVAMAAGCASNYQMANPVRLSRSGLMDDPVQAAAIEKSMTDEEIGRLLDARIQPKLPTSLAVADVSSVGWRAGLRPLSAVELAEWQKVVAGLPPITGIQPVPAIVAGGAGLKLRDLRVAAARVNCELLLVYLESSSAIDNYNEAAALYWTFVGLWLVPGNVYEHRTVMQAVLVDCRTGAILGTATGDCHLKEACPAAYGRVKEEQLAQEAPRRALADLQKGCKALLRQVVAAAPKPASPPGLPPPAAGQGAGGAP